MRSVSAPSRTNTEGMMLPPKTDTDQGVTEARLIAVVITLAMVLWMGIQYFGDQMQWPPRFIFLADLSAGAAFLWSMVATYRLWRRRQA